jgi:DNA-binding transcriptional LysR family regulator
VLDRRFIHVVTTARCGSFTAAAERVGLTQSGVTKSVADLERQVGFVIFTRTPHGVILTEEGRRFVERASRLIDEAQDLLKGAFTGSDPYAVALRIGVCPASIDWLLVEPVSLLKARHPGLRLEISAASFDRTVEKLRTGALDVAFGFEAAFQGEPDFHCNELPGMRTELFVRRDHPILGCPQVTFAELAKYEMISPSDSRPYDRFMREIYEKSQVDAQTKIHFIDSFPIVARLVARTDAIGFVSVAYTRTEVFRRRYARVPFLEYRPVSPLCCATRLRFAPRPAVRAFIKACHEGLRSLADGEAEFARSVLRLSA